MASSDKQVMELLDRLHMRTGTGEMKWQRSSQPEAFQSRIGDFMVTIGPTNYGLLTSTDALMLQVTRLDDGQVVETMSAPRNALSPRTYTKIPPSHENKLKEIYQLVVGGNSGIEELLKLLR